MAIPHKRETSITTRIKKKYSPPSKRSRRVTFSDDLACTGYQTDVDEMVDNEFTVTTPRSNDIESYDVTKIEKNDDVIHFETPYGNHPERVDEQTKNGIDEDLVFFDENDGECNRRENNETIVSNLKGSVRNFVGSTIGFICSRTIGYDQ